MADSDKTLSQTIRAVMTDTRTPATTVLESTDNSNPVVEGDTKSVETPEVYLGQNLTDMLKDVSEQDRSKVKEALKSKLREGEKLIQQKSQEFAPLKKAQEFINQLGYSPDEAINILKTYHENKNNLTKQEQKNMRTLDTLLEKMPDTESREGLNNLRKISHEEVEDAPIVKKLLKEIEDLKKNNQFSMNDLTIRRTNDIKNSLNDLKSIYGDLVHEFESQVISEGLKYPQADPESILSSIAAATNPKKLRETILSNTVKKNDRQQEKINAVSSPSSGMTSPMQTINVRETSLKGIMAQVFAKK